MTVLIGRTHEVELLAQALHAARTGAGRFVLIAGEAGIGKSRLIAELHTRAIAGQFEIVQGHCFEQDLSFPYAPWIDALPTEYPEGDEPVPLHRCWSTWAELELAQGNPRRALEIVERLLAATPNLTQYGSHAVPYLSHLRAQALVALGRMEEAEAELQGTLPVALKHGQRQMLWRLHAETI